MFYKLILLALFICLFHHAESQFRRCNKDRLTRCQDAFQNLTGIDLRLNWREVRRRVEDSYGGRGGNNNDTNFRKACRGFHEYGTCLREEYYACYNIPYMVQNDSMALQDAYNYLAIFLQTHFVCGAGFNTFINNEECFLDVWSNRRETLDFCLSQFNLVVSQNLNNPDPNAICMLGDSYKTCVQLVFDKWCNGGLDAKWWGCEYARTDVITQFPFCSTASFRCVQSVVPAQT